MQIRKLTLFITALAFAAGAFGASCPLVATVAQLQALGSCTIGSQSQGLFSNFTTSLDPSTVVGVTFSDGDFGVTFSPAGGSTDAYSVGFTASTIPGWIINGFSGSTTENPAGSSTYMWVVNGNIGGGGDYNVSFPPVTSASAFGYFFGNGVSQSLTLDFQTSRVPAETPEPTSLILFGSGLIGLGIWRRRRG